MPTTLILGGAGKVARQVTRLLLLPSQQPPHTIYSIIRNPAQADELRSLGAHPIVLSLEEASVADLADAMRRVSPDTVVWCAGAPFREPDRVEAVDRDAAIKAMDACAVAGKGARRFVSVSMLDLRDRERVPYPEWYDERDREASDRMWGGVMGRWCRAKLAADTELRRGNERRGLEYTIVRPGGLSDADGVGAVAAGRVHFTGKMVNRADLAAVVVECIGNRDTIGLAFDVVGGDTPVVDAVARVGREKEDTFEA